jgi:hypothetical protein
MNEDHEIIQKLRSKINRAVATFKGPGSDDEVLLKMFEILIQDDETETPTKEQK